MSLFGLFSSTHGEVGKTKEGERKRKENEKRMRERKRVRGSIEIVKPRGKNRELGIKEMEGGQGNYGGKKNSTGKCIFRKDVEQEKSGKIGEAS